LVSMNHSGTNRKDMRRKTKRKENNVVVNTT